MLPVASLLRFLLLMLRLNPTERLIHGSPSQSQEGGLGMPGKTGNRSIIIVEDACWVASKGSRVQIPAAR